MNTNITLILSILTLFWNCTGKTTSNTSDENTHQYTRDTKLIDTTLPLIGILAFEGVLTTEVTAPMDVFTKHSEDGKPLFNVITIGEETEPVVSEEGLKIIPDFSFENAPQLDVLFVPSAYDMHAQVNNQAIIEFIKQQNENTQYTVSNCAGAHLIGQSGIADGKKIVTWIGGGEELQNTYPNLKVQDDSVVSFVEDGKFLSSNGNLASYISSLELVEKLTNGDHRKYVESYLYIDRLCDWDKYSPQLEE
ncbi:DJ-1/PfpI family protein [Membranihabitans maritimus]|uniref:DJ-1/PfpI family protein n=1 Tax=Membranihabitans maritimus TaxID=2904244 RepID=UPI001F219CA4|nr:DJ-1/PfpI family protein [Membranihabitans maritimus]